VWMRLWNADSRSLSADRISKMAIRRSATVLTLVARGWSNQEISESLYVTSATTKTHVSRLLMKLGARDRAQLIVIAYETGLVSAR